MAESEKIESLLCKNCKKEIPSANHEMHEMHCVRNIIMCEKCGETVSKDSLESHIKEIHAVVVCPECDVAVENQILQKHKDELCIARLQECYICELSLPKYELDEHTKYCGARTEKCDKCESYIKLLDMDKHVENNCAYPELTLSKRKEKNVKLENNRSLDINTYLMQKFYDTYFTENYSQLHDSYKDIPVYDNVFNNHLDRNYNFNGNLYQGKNENSSHSINLADQFLADEMNRNLNFNDSLDGFSDTAGCGEDNSPVLNTNKVSYYNKTNVYFPPMKHNDRINNDSFYKNNKGRYNNANHSKEDFSSPVPELLPCQFCDTLISLSELEWHQVTCTVNPFVSQDDNNSLLPDWSSQNNSKIIDNLHSFQKKSSFKDKKDYLFKDNDDSPGNQSAKSNIKPFNNETRKNDHHLQNRTNSRNSNSYHEGLSNCRRNDSFKDSNSLPPIKDNVKNTSQSNRGKNGNIKKNYWKPLEPDNRSFSASPNYGTYPGSSNNNRSNNKSYQNEYQGRKDNFENRNFNQRNNFSKKSNNSRKPNTNLKKDNIGNEKNKKGSQNQTNSDTSINKDRDS